ncbi:MAG TPA: DUF501 domain-containing protein [Miltoncostaeaceae bacterium]|nr:DUF501 domain-containing protein [Miltoncostaeaceae bacterium]
MVARLGREPFTDYRVSVRCRHGRPAVLRNTPRDAEGRPFPTREWLLDPGLRAAVSRLEAAGGVRMLENDPRMSAPLAAAHARHAALHAGYRVAGAGDPRYVKCLHAQLAFALAEGGNPVGDWVMSHAGIDWPADCCPDLSDDGDNPTVGGDD